MRGVATIGTLATTGTSTLPLRSFPKNLYIVTLNVSTVFYTGLGTRSLVP